MKKNRMIIIYSSVLFLAIFVAVIMPVVCIYYLISNNIIRLGLNIFMLIAISYCIIKLLGEWISWQVNMQCEFTEYLNMLQKMTKTMLYKNDAKIHLALLKAYLIMGMYDEASTKLNDFEKYDFKLSDLQKMILQILHISYLRQTHSSSFSEELDKGFAVLGNVNSKDNERFQKSLLLQKHLQEEKWEDIIKIQQETIVQSTLEQVESAYLLGLCYFNLGVAKEADRELEFVVKYGGDTKYVSLANRMLGKTSANNKDEKRLIKNNNKKKRVLKYVFIGIMCIVLFILINFFKRYGNSISEVYCKEYYIIREDDIQIIYEQEIDNYELVILSDGNNIAYGLYEKDVTNTENCYSLYYSYRVSIKKLISNYLNSITAIDKWTESENTKLEFLAQQEIWELIKDFYKKIYKKGVFDETTSYCVGISFNEYVKDIEISNQVVDIQDFIEIDEDQAFIWSIRDVNLKTIDFFDIGVSDTDVRMP